MKRYLVVAMILMLVFANGCARIQEPFPSPDNTQAPQEIEENQEELPVAGGELFIYMPNNPKSLNPLFVQTKEMVNLLSLVYEGIVKYNENLKHEPSLAESWDVSSDGSTWTFHLRRGVLWQKTEKEFSSDDVIFTLDTLKSTEEASIYKNGMENIVSYEAPDPNTIVIKTGKPGSWILDFMTLPIISRDYYEGRIENASLLPMGTGPYQVDRYEKMKEMQLIVNPKWWKKTPYISKITAKALPDNETALESYSANQLDFVPTETLTASKYKEAGDTEILEYMTQNYDFLAPNMNHVLFQDKRVRQAIMYAIDRKDIISRVYLNHAVVVDVPLPPDSWLYDHKFQKYDYQIEEAQKRMEEAGWKDTDGDGILEKTIDGKVEEAAFTLLTDDNPENPVRKETAGLIKESLAKLGMKVNVLALPWEDFTKAIEEKNFDMVLAGYYLDRNPDLAFAFHSANIEGGKNFISYSDAEMDKLLDDAAVEENEEQLKTIYVALQQKISEDLPYMSLFFRTGTLIYRQKIKGIKAPRDMALFQNIDQWYLKD